MNIKKIKLKNNLREYKLLYTIITKYRKKLKKYHVV